MQPGISKAEASRDQLELLRATENHLMDQLPFTAIRILRARRQCASRCQAPVPRRGLRVARLDVMRERMRTDGALNRRGQGFASQRFPRCAQALPDSHARASVDGLAEAGDGIAVGAVRDAPQVAQRVCRVDGQRGVRRSSPSPVRAVRSRSASTRPALWSWPTPRGTAARRYLKAFVTTIESAHQ